MEHDGYESCLAKKQKLEGLKAIAGIGKNNRQTLTGTRVRGDC